MHVSLIWVWFIVCGFQLLPIHTSDLSLKKLEETVLRNKTDER